MSIDLRSFKNDITSQYGENGIIEKIFDIISPKDKVCVEFGGYDLKEFSNVFPLWSSKGWKSIIIEGDKERTKKIKRDYQNFIKKNKPSGSAEIINSYVTPDGERKLDNTLARKEINKNFDLLSIDVDGVDYHIWKLLENYKPRVVIIEINETVPPNISMIGKMSGNYVGCGILDICKLGNQKGYDLVACTVTNAIFVVREESKPFMNKNNIEELFDYRRITYAFSAYDGSIFFSQRPTFRYFDGVNYVSNEFSNIENSESFWRPNFRSEFAFLLQQIIRRLFPSLYNKSKNRLAKKFSK